METSRPRHVLPLIFIATLALMLLAVAPALAAPTSSSSSASSLATHVDPEDCNLTVDAGGNLFLDGEALADALTAAQVLVVEALIVGDLAAAIDAAADADADVCLNLTVGLDGATIVAAINGHIDICPATVAVNADGDLVVNGVVFASDLADSDLAALAAFAASIDADLCASIAVTDNEVDAAVVLRACVDATLNSDDTVTLSVGEDELILDADAFASLGLEVGATIEIGLLVTANVDLATDAVTIAAQIVVIAGCGAGEPGPTGAPGPGVGGGTTTLPDAAAAPNGSGAGNSALLIGLVMLGALATLGYGTIATRRSR